MGAVLTPDVGSPILPTDPVVFDLTDSVEVMTNILIAVRHDTGVIELAHDGTSFTSFYASGSSRTVITNGYRYSLRRAGGWADTKVVVSAFPFAGTGVGLINFSSDFGVLSDPPGEDVALSVTGATAGSFGNASHVATFTVDSKGRLTASGQTAIVLTDNSSSPIAHVGSGGATATSAANIGDVNSAVAVEATARAAADTSEATARAAADTTLTTNLNTEIANRIAGDATLTTNLSTEITNRIAGDTTLTTNLATETAARIAGDAAVTALIPALSSATPVAVDAAAGTAGTGTSTSRNDHKHSVTVGSPVATGTANADGTGTALARADHVHQTSFAGVAAALAAATADVSLNSHKITSLASGGTTPTNAANIGDIISAQTTLEADGIATGTVQLASLAFPAAGLVICKVASVKDEFVLDRTSTLTADGITIVTALGGTGRWIRLLIPHAFWVTQTDWKIDPSGGNDENLGDASHALKTRSEFFRRMKNAAPIASINVTITASLNAGDTFVAPIHIPLGAPAVVLTFIGVPVPIFTGTITGYVQRAGSSNVVSQMTISGMTGTWSTSGPGGTSLVGKIIEGLNGSSQLIRSVVVKDLGSKTAKVAPPVLDVTFQDTTFAVGQTVTVYDLPSIGSYATNPTTGNLAYKYLAAGFFVENGHRSDVYSCTGQILQTAGVFNLLNVSATSCISNGGLINISGGYMPLFASAAGLIRVTASMEVVNIRVEGGGTIAVEQGQSGNVPDLEFETTSLLRCISMLGSSRIDHDSGWMYGSAPSGTHFVDFVDRGCVMVLGRVPNITNATIVSSTLPATTGSVSDLATKEYNDTAGNRLIGPAGPTVNDNASQPIAHLGSGGSTPTNAANIADVQLVSPLAAMTRVPKAGEYWVYCIDQDSRTLAGNDATAAPGIAVAPSRVVVVTGSDNVVASILTWTFANANFTSNDAGGSFKLTGATNAAGWVIATVVNSTTVTTTIARVGGGVPVDETFTGGATLTVTGGRGAAMAAALALAVTTPFKTYERAGQMTPRVGNLANLVALVRPRVGGLTYKDMDGTTDADWSKWLKNIDGWDYIGHRPTGDFSNSTFDKIQCGYRIAAGTNASGYAIVPTRSVSHAGGDNVVGATSTWTFTNAAFTVTDCFRDLVVGGGATNSGTWRIIVVVNATTVVTSGTPVNETFGGGVTLSVNSSQRSFGIQLAGGGAAGLPLEGTAIIEGQVANGISDVTGRRVRFLPTSTTTALQSFCTGVYSNDASGITPMFQIPALATVGDVFVIEEHELVVGNMQLKIGQVGNIGMVLGRTYQSGGPSITHASTGVVHMAGLEALNDPNQNVHAVFTNCLGINTLLWQEYIDETVTLRNVGCAGRGRLEPLFMPMGIAIASWFGMETGQRATLEINRFRYGPGCVNNGGFKFIGGGRLADQIATGRVGIDAGADAESSLYSTAIGLDTADGTSGTASGGGFFGSFIYPRTRFPAAGAGANYPAPSGTGALYISGAVSVRIRGVDISRSNPAIGVRGYGAKIFIDDVVSRDGGNVVFLDLQQAYGARIVIGTQAAVVPNSSSADITMFGGVTLPLSGLSMTSYRDSHDNLVIGTGGLLP